MNDTTQLIRMANRIGEFFAAMPDHDEALAGVAGHIRRYWAPGMRADLARALAAGDVPGLLPLVHEALVRHPQALAPGTRTS